MLEEADPELNALLIRVLSPDPTLRPSALDLLCHPIFSTGPIAPPSRSTLSPSESVMTML